VPLSQKRNLGHCLHKIFDICISVRSGPDQLEAALSVPITVAMCSNGRGDKCGLELPLLVYNSINTVQMCER